MRGTSSDRPSELSPIVDKGRASLPKGMSPHGMPD